MDMPEQIRDLAKQLSWEPSVTGTVPAANSFIVCGMGGSALEAGLLKIAEPKLDLSIHRDYGLPRVPDYFLEQSLIILSSYSGNTEETLDAGQAALSRGLKLVVISTGGKLLDWAKSNQLAYIQLPTTDLQPRLALGYILRALAKLTKQNLPTSLTLIDSEKTGQELAAKLKGKIPLIYSSTLNLPLAYNWKIKFNETAKIPAFYNVLPELNHNEMTGFIDNFNSLFRVLWLKAETDNPRITKRGQVLSQMYKDRGLAVEEILFEGANVWEQILNSVGLADWTAYHLAQIYHHEPSAVPLVEEFKKLIF